MSAPALNCTANKVLKAALSCVDKNGFAFLYARKDVNLYVINQAKFQRLEAAVAEYREARKR